MKDAAIQAFDRDVSAKELGAMLNLTGERLRQLTHLGILKKVGRGQFHLSRSLKSYVDYKDAASKKQIARSALRTRLIEAQAYEIELRVSEKRARLIPRVEVEHMLEEVCEIVQEELEELPVHLKEQGYSVDKINRLKLIFSNGLTRIEKGHRRVVRRLRTGDPK